MFDVVLVSVFGRENWLAAEMAEKGLKVALVDVSEQFGRWAPEDWEGPFGFFKTNQLKASQIERLSEEDYLEPIEEGFTLLLNQGPLELTGTMAPFCLDKYNISSVGLNYIEGYGKSSEKSKSLLRGIAQLGFEENWFVQFSHQVASNVFKQNTEGMDIGKPLPLFSPYFVRRVTRRGQEKSLDWCEKKGVKVYRRAKVKDIRVGKKGCESIELESDWSGALPAQIFVWGLSSQETKRLPGPVFSTLYPKGEVAPTWNWIRFRYQLHLNENTNVIPVKFVIVDDLYLSWTHENLCVVQKTVKEGHYDIWVRIPNQQRFHRSYLDELGHKIAYIVDRKIPHSNPELVDKPQDYLYEEAELGPPRFPVFAENDLKKLKEIKLSNMEFDGPEQWTHLEWNSQFTNQEEILNRVLVCREKLKQKETKQSESQSTPISP